MSITRDGVLRTLGRRGRPPWTAKALLRELGGGRHERRTLSALLRELVHEGRLERSQGRYRLRRSDGLVEATFQGAPRSTKGLGTAHGDDGTTWQIVGGAPAEVGERVLLEPLGPSRKRHAEIVRSLGGTPTELIGIVSREAFGASVTPYRDEREWGVRVHPSELGGARDGDVVVLHPSRRRQRAGAPSARVVEVLGPPGSPEADFRAVAWRHRIPLEFPHEVLADADGLAPRLDAAELGRRVDLRSRPFVTIDPADARDHDDAVCVEPQPGGGARLWVAIADVSHYVAEGSALDAEALRRGNSVYFPDRAIPMLPERLSGDLCSLRPSVDRFTMVVELEIDAHGNVGRRSFYPAVMRSRRRLSYDAAAALMEGKAPDGDVEPPVRDSLRRLAHLARVLMRQRFAAGSIDFDLPEAEIVLGDDGHPVDIVEAPRTIAHRAIEEAMLVANRVVAECLEASGLPSLYRIHAAPSPADMQALRDLLQAFGLLESRPDQAIEPLHVARAIQRVSGRPEERLVNLVALRCMQQARYQAENLGHFALAFRSYTHFTSPIRRYADLLVHRALKDLLSEHTEARRRAQRRAERVSGIAARVSWCERVAMEAEREAVSLKKCAFMAKRIGEEFHGTISGVTRQGFYVTLDPFFVEGLVHVSTLDGYFVLDERSYSLVARRTRVRFQLGERVHVLVDHVDPVKAWINFSLVQRLPPQRRRKARIEPTT
jgi:ribonuclease R